jgi:hypothetical protein
LGNYIKISDKLRGKGVYNDFMKIPPFPTVFSQLNWCFSENAQKCHLLIKHDKMVLNLENKHEM